MPDPDEERTLLAFCVVANVSAETAQGNRGLDIRSGLKHFAAGAKVWVLPPQWGDGGERVFVIGRHRGSAGPYIRIVVLRQHLTNYRVRGVYSPALLRTLTRPWPQAPGYGPRLWETRQAAEAAAAMWRVPTLTAELDTPPWRTEVLDPPPLDLERDGRTFYLAHFNARRAVYSSQPPPVENA